MPLKIALSHVKAMPFDFEAEVEKYRQARVHHQTTEGEGAPSAPDVMVERAVKRVPREGVPDDFVADYEIVNDTPPVRVPTLDERKAVLAGAVNTKANELIAAIAPPLKRRFWAIEHQRIQGEMQKVAKKENEPLDVWRDRALGIIKATVPADCDHVLAEEARHKKIAAISRHAAVCESDIHDLTEETIGGWSMPPFPA